MHKITKNIILLNTYLAFKGRFLNKLSEPVKGTQDSSGLILLMSEYFECPFLLVFLTFD